MRAIAYLLYLEIQELEVISSLLSWKLALRGHLKISKKKKLFRTPAEVVFIMHVVFIASYE